MYVTAGNGIHASERFSMNSPSGNVSNTKGLEKQDTLYVHRQTTSTSVMTSYGLEKIHQERPR